MCQLYQWNIISDQLFMMMMIYHHYLMGMDTLLGEAGLYECHRGVKNEVRPGVT